MTFLDPKKVPVPAADSADNNYMQDVIGNKTDTHSGISLYGRVKTLNEHIHSASKVYPTLASGVTVTAGAAWTLGNFSEIVPVSTIGSPFDIHHVSIENISANDVYELVLYYDADGTPGDEVECGRVRVTKNASQDSTLNIPMQTPIIPADYQIKAKLASSAGGNSVDITIFYHVY